MSCIQIIRWRRSGSAFQASPEERTSPLTRTVPAIRPNIEFRDADRNNGHDSRNRLSSLRSRPISQPEACTSSSRAKHFVRNSLAEIERFTTPVYAWPIRLCFRLYRNTPPTDNQPDDQPQPIVDAEAGHQPRFTRTPRIGTTGTKSVLKGAGDRAGSCALPRFQCKR